MQIVAFLSRAKSLESFRDSNGNTIDTMGSRGSQIAAVCEIPHASMQLVLFELK